MADVTGDPCCAPDQQATCCEASEKVDCCGHGEDCGCDAGATDIHETVREHYVAGAVRASTDPGARCCCAPER